jgi:hypothetical protein
MRGAPAVDARAKRHDDVEQHLHVADARHVAQLARLVGQHAGGDERQGGVLVAFDSDAPRQRAASFDLQ